jgi:enoyl-CoA hydratase
MLSDGYALKVMCDSETAAMALVEKGTTLIMRMLSLPYLFWWHAVDTRLLRVHFYCFATHRTRVHRAFKSGLNEVAIGMTMHHGGVELPKGRLAPVFFNRSVILAEMVSPQEAVTAGSLGKVISEAKFVITVRVIA